MHFYRISIRLISANLFNTLYRCYFRTLFFCCVETSVSPEPLHTTLEDLQVFIDLGEYRAGQNAENDFAMNARPKLTNWLKQSVNEKMPMSETLKELERIVK